MRQKRLSFLPGILLALLWLLAPTSGATAAEPGENYPSVTLWPLAYHYEDDSRARTDILWPIYHQTRKGSHHRLAIRPFLFNLERDAQRNFRQLNLIWPLSHFETENDDLHNWIFPLYFQKRNRNEASLMLWPLYGQSRHADGSRSWSTLYPFFQYHRDSDARNWQFDYLWPLGQEYRDGQSRGGYFLPLFWRQSSPDEGGGFIIPYFWHSTEDKKTKALLPLWYSESSLRHRRGFFFPYFWSITDDKTRRALLPLWYASRDGEQKSDFILPWFSHRGDKSRFQTLVPVYMHWGHRNGDRMTLLPPFYWDSSFGDKQLRILFPFYFRHADSGEQTALRYFFPFYGDYRSGTEVRHRYYLFPLYARINDPEKQRRAWYFLWPLAYSESTPAGRESWAMPLYWSRTGKEFEARMGLGLYWDLRRQKQRLTLLLPLYLKSESPRLTTRHLFPFYSDISKPDGWRKQFYLGPLAIKTADPSNDRKQFDLLWPLVSKKDTGDRHHLRILPFYWHDRDPGRELTIATPALLPPYYINARSTRQQSFHIWPFYGSERDEEYHERSIAWPLIRWGSDPTGERSAWQVLLAYREQDRNDSRWGLFPLWHSYRTDRLQRTSSLLHWQERRVNSGWQFSLLHLGDGDLSLFTIKNRNQRHHQHLFPLYSYSHNPKVDHTDLYVLGPIYTYQREGAASSRNRLLWKFLYRDREGESSETGFLWRFIRQKKGAEGSLFEFNPFYYGESRKDGRRFTSWLGGLYSMRTTESGNRHRLFWLINWSTAKTRGPG